MKLSLKPAVIPFKVDDEVFINQPYSSFNHAYVGDDSRVYFQARIIRIFLEFSDKVSIVKERKDVHDLEVTTIIYDLKPIGPLEGAGRIALHVDLEAAEAKVFANKEELLTYQPDVQQTSERSGM